MKQIVLMYHDIIGHDKKESGFLQTAALKYKVNVDNFEAQIAAVDRYLKDKGLCKNQVVFTFDDGGESFLTEVAPILEKYGFSGIFFIATGYIGTPGFLSVSQIKELAARGHIIGSHSHSHPSRMNSLKPSEIVEEWRYSKMLLDDILPAETKIASIPNGYSSKEVLRAMRDNGLTVLYTSEPVTKIRHYMNAQVIGRYAVTCNTTVDMLINLISSRGVRIRLAVRYKSLGILKRLLGDTYPKLKKHFSSLKL